MHNDSTPGMDAATPILISTRTRQVLIGAGVFAVGLLLWRVTTLVSLVVGGASLAVALSFPVEGLSRVMPRRAAIAVSLAVVAALILLAITVFAPVIVDQLSALAAAVPGFAQQLDERLPSIFDALASRGLLPGPPDRALAETQARLLEAVQQFAGQLLGQFGQVVSGVAAVVVALMGVLLVAVTLLANARSIHAFVLRAAPHRYRRDVRSLWNSLGETLSRYLGGLILSLLIEGVLAAIVFHQVGLPYALLLGAWVSITAVVPYVSAWLGYGPAVLLALAISPRTALLTLALGIAVNAIVGNVVTPRIQGKAVQVHPMLVFLAVVAGGELFGIPGVILAVPAMAVLRVVLDFLRARVRVAADNAVTAETEPGPPQDAVVNWSAGVRRETGRTAFTGPAPRPT